MSTLYRASLVFALVGCLPACVSSSPVGGDNPGGGGGGGGGTGGEPAPTNTVSVRDNEFSPVSISVGRGDVVVWEWVGSTRHNVTWVESGFANSPTQSDGTHEVTMPATPVQLGYYCSIHGTPSTGMRGTIVVE